MKKILSAIILTSLLVVLLVPAVVLALKDIPQTSIDTPGELVGLINTIGTWVFSALLAVVVIMLVLSGFYWLTAGGNAEQTKKARQMLTNALIGLAIALGARGLTAIITTLLA